MIFYSDYYEMKDGKPYTSKCDICGKVIEYKWIICPHVGILCTFCAHHMMRVLLEDIIAYHNDVPHIFLTNVMYNGAEDKQDKECHHYYRANEKNRYKRCNQVMEEPGSPKTYIHH